MRRTAAVVLRRGGAAVQGRRAPPGGAGVQSPALRNIRTRPGTIGRRRSLPLGDCSERQRRGGGRALSQARRPRVLLQRSAQVVSEGAGGECGSSAYRSADGIPHAPWHASIRWRLPAAFVARLHRNRARSPRCIAVVGRSLSAAAGRYLARGNVSDSTGCRAGDGGRKCRKCSQEMQMDARHSRCSVSGFGIPSLALMGLCDKCNEHE